MIKIKKFLHGLSQSHRSHHIVVGFFVGLFFGADTAAWVGIAFECKDVQHDPRNAKRTFRDWAWEAWDYVDFICTVAGGFVGNVLRWFALGWF